MFWEFGYYAPNFRAIYLKCSVKDAKYMLIMKIYSKFGKYLIQTFPV